MDDTHLFNSSRVIFFIGNSGSGKDTIMRKLKENLELNDISVYIPKRRITRENHESEKFISVNEETFLNLLNTNKFILSWFIYGNYYGYLKDDIMPYLDGKTYLFMNISRGVASKAVEIFPQSRFVRIVVDDEVAIQRIKNRKRDSEDMLNKRIERMKKDIILPNIFLLY